MKPGRILVTGHTGYLGPFVLDALRDAHPQASLHGAARRVPPPGGGPAGCDHAHQLDLRDRAGTARLVATLRPDAVVHLASLRNATFDELVDVNVRGFETLLSCLSDTAPDTRVVALGSAAELGTAGGVTAPLAEDCMCDPVDAYGVTKLAQSGFARMHALRGLAVVRLRVFNVVGPGAPDTLLPGRCAALLREAGRASGVAPLAFGRLDTLRDYVDVRDVARAVVLALGKGRAGALYHVASGTARSGAELVETLKEIAGLGHLPHHVRDSAEAPLVQAQVGDNRLARRELGWQPTIGWRQSLRDLWASQHEAAVQR